MSIVVSILGAWATLYGLYYKTYERSLLQGLYVTLVRRINVGARRATGGKGAAGNASAAVGVCGPTAKCCR